METTISALAGAVVRIRAVLAAVMFVSAACPAWAGVSVERFAANTCTIPWASM